MLFFNGNLLVSPAVVSQVDDSAMADTGATVGNVLAILGQSTQGMPNTALPFSDPTDAADYFGSGDLADAASRVFAPSPETNSPQTVLFIRVNPALQSSLTLVDGAARNVIVLNSSDYGLYTKQIKVKAESGSAAGLKLTTQLGNAYYSQDNVTRQAFTVQYTGGQASATLAVDNTANTVTLDAPSGTPVAVISLATYSSIQQLVDYINTVAGFAATIAPASAQKPALAGLDSLNPTDVRTAPYVVMADLQAAIDWFNGNSEGFVTATRGANAGGKPIPIPFTYLTGGTDGTVTNTQWTNAFQTLQSADAQWVVPLSSDPSIAAMADAHVQYMSNVARLERRAICGTALGTSDSTAISDALAINSDRTSLIHLGMYDYDPNGVLTLYEPFMTAAMVAAGFAGLNPGDAMTNKALNIRGLERNLRDPTDTDPLILGGVMPIEATKTGFRVTQSISTWLTNDNFNRVEQSCGAATDYCARTVRNALAKYKGSRGDPITLGSVVADTETALRLLSQPAPAGLGVLVGNAASPPFKNIKATLTGNVIAVRFQASPVIPVNYVAITIFIVPFSGSASAA